MSECVVRMEMPEKCQGCPVEIYGCCGITNKNIMLWNGGFPDERPSDCPILAVLPENHGRLVDMKDIDSMMEDIQTTSDESGLYGLYYRDDFDFDGLPTIVPATEGGKHE